MSTPVTVAYHVEGQSRIEIGERAYRQEADHQELDFTFSLRILNDQWGWFLFKMTAGYGLVLSFLFMCILLHIFDTLALPLFLIVITMTYWYIIERYADIELAVVLHRVVKTFEEED